MDAHLILQLADITFGYEPQAIVLHHLDFSLKPGEKVGLVGENGSGKTTLLHVIMGLQKPATGTITFLGKTVSQRKDFENLRQQVGLIFQDADDQLFCPTVMEDVAFGPLNQGKSREAAQAASRKILHDLSISHLADRFTHKLSGGEKKMVALAGILAMEPQMLLLDEPTTGLDPDTRTTLLAIIKKLNMACVIISHEYDFLVEVTDTLYVMKNGQLVVDAGEMVHSHYHVHPHGTFPHEHTS